MSWLSKQFNSAKSIVHNVDPVAKLTDKGLGAAYDKLKNFSDFEKVHLKDMFEQIKKNPGRVLYGSFDPISTKLWNKLLGTDYTPIMNQLGGPTQENYQHAREQGVKGVAGTETLHDTVGTIASLFGGYGLGKVAGRGAAALGAVGEGGGEAAGGVAGSTADGVGEVAGSGLGEAATGGAGVVGDVAGAGYTLPGVTITAGGGGGAGLGGLSTGLGLAANYGASLATSGTSGSGGISDYNPDVYQSGEFPSGSTQTLPSGSNGLWSSLGNMNLKDWYGVGSSLYGLYQSYSQQQMAKTAMERSDPFGPYRGIYAGQLAELMKDPNLITKDPGYQFQFEQGEQAVTRQMAAKGMLGSGNMGIALTKYGQDYAKSYYDDKTKFLAGLAGANIAPNFGPGLAAYNQGIDTASNSLASLGYGMSGHRNDGYNHTFGTGVERSWWGG